MALHAIINAVIGVFCLYLFITSTFRRPEPRPELSPNPEFYQSRINNINRLVRGNDVDCHEQLRVNRHTFLRLCCLVRGVGLGDSRNVCLEERVAIFLFILSHHTKQRCMKYDFYRSTETISRHFNAVLQTVMRLHQTLLVTPEPVPANYHDTRWNWFQNCLGVLDGMYVPVNPPAVDWARHRSRKGEIATNVLGVCTWDLKFVYVLYGWEGSATDSRILGNTLERPHGLKVPHVMATNEIEVVDMEGPSKQKRRSWKKVEQDALMKCILNEEGDRWKSENGFRTGYFTHLQKELQKVLPGCTLKANPHIDSKFKHWKTIWARLVDITGLSGFGWDAVNNRIDVEQPIWNEYEKSEVANKSAEPHNSNDFYEALFTEYDVCLPNTPTTPTTLQAFTPYASLPTSTPRGSMPEPKKGGRGQEWVKRTCPSMQAWTISSNVHVEKLANSFAYEKELSARRTMVKEELSKLNITLEAQCHNHEPRREG
ncbi:hypothetical protein RHMOL_Rhmol08G0212500 [Rhododendron molle]|uniref:Uncharacterized protein n=1 Tax=Rhododendron molle TaxID=49168 RepID=A0ACC0MRJ9_RHOML|nr:hypothetical protein RHMOL_Rhmol08G0212500 [Rhododendron molle]